MIARLYFDDDVGARAVLRELRNRGTDSVSSVEAERFGSPDEEHLRYAASEGRVLVTGNRGDFARLHALWLSRGDEHAGIILVDQRLTIGSRLQAFGELLGAIDAADFVNRLEYLKQWLPPAR